MLARHYVAGRLSLTELEWPVDAVRMGRTRGQLAAMTADLPSAVEEGGGGGLGLTAPTACCCGRTPAPSTSPSTSCSS